MTVTSQASFVDVSGGIDAVCYQAIFFSELIGLETRNIVVGRCPGGFIGLTSAVRRGLCRYEYDVGFGRYRA